MLPKALLKLLVLLAGAVPGARVANSVKSRELMGMSSSCFRSITWPHLGLLGIEERGCRLGLKHVLGQSGVQQKVLSLSLSQLKHNSPSNLRPEADVLQPDPIFAHR